MALTLLAHPFSSYSQKVLIALYENGTSFDYRTLDNARAAVELAKLWPMRRFPVLRDGDRTVVEASIIIEHLALHHPGPVRLIPDDADAALDVRTLDRFFDNYVMAPMQKIVLDHLRPADMRDSYGVNEAREMLDRAYAWLDGRLADGEWAVGSNFTLVDCAAAPSLFYADWVHAIAPAFANVRAYRGRLLSRPSVARAVDEARPYRALFPPGAPDRD